MSKQQIGADNWLHIVSHALRNYVQEGGGIVIDEAEGEIRVRFVGVGVGDGRLHPQFRKLVVTAVEVEGVTEAGHGLHSNKV